MAQELEALRQTIASHPAPAANSPQPAATDPGAPPSAGAPPPAQPSPIVSPQRAFDTSNDDYSAGRFELAVQGFQQFLQQFPRTPQAGTAEFYIGMSYYNLNKWGDARDAFLKVINDYPQTQGTIVPDAYYKLGQTYERLNQSDAAKKAYEAAVQKFPGSLSALSSQALQRLNKR
jgi:tol-pal system protein YbgF